MRLNRTTTGSPRRRPTSRSNAWSIRPRCAGDERDYLELKQEVGLGHYEGRGWRGFHHHATLCIAAYGFLISEKETIPPSGPACARRRSQSTLPADCRPRGFAAAVTTPCAEFHRHAAHPPRAYA